MKRCLLIIGLASVSVILSVRGTATTASRFAPRTDLPKTALQRGALPATIITVDTARNRCIDAGCTAPILWQGWEVIPTGIYDNTAPFIVANGFPGARPAWWADVLANLDDLGVNRVSLGERPGIQNSVDWYGAFIQRSPTPTPPPGTTWNWNYQPNAPMQWSHNDLFVGNIIKPLKDRLALRGESLFWEFEYYNNSGPYNFTRFRDNPTEFADWVWKIWDHNQTVYGIVPDGFCLNEVTTTGGGWNTQQIANAVVAIGDRLAASNWHPRFGAPTSEHVSNAITDTTALAGVTGNLADYWTDVEFHTYGGYTTTQLQQLALLADMDGPLQIGMTEHIGDDPARDIDQYIREGKISFYRQYNMGGYSAGTTAFTSGGVSTKAWLFYIDTDDSERVHITNPNGYLIRQFSKYIHMGAQEVDVQVTAGSSYDFRPVAFVNVNGVPAVVVNVIPGSGGDFRVAGLPAGTYHVSWTLENGLDSAHQAPDQTISFGEELVTAIPGAGLITIAGDDAMLPTPTPTVPTVPAGCDSAPRFGCRTSGKSLLRVEGGPDDSRKLIWKWLKGAQTDLSAFGHPVTGSTSYAVCVYGSSGGSSALAMSMVVPGSTLCGTGPCWHPLGTTGFKYNDTAASTDGIKKIMLRTGANGRAKIFVRGIGANLPAPIPFDADDLLDQDPTVTVQLVNSDGQCWEAGYAAPAMKVTGTQFNDRF